MKIRRILAFAVAIAMVLSIVPAMSLTASATTNTYYATAVGHSGSASGTGIFVGTGTKTTTGNENGAPYTGDTSNGNATLGSTRVGYVSFSVPMPTQDVISATMRLYVTGVNGNIGKGKWMKMAAYRTTGTPSSVKVGGMNAAEYPAVNNDYSYDAAYWSQTQIWDSTKNTWKDFDVTEALKAAIDEAEEGAENVTLSFRLQVPIAGLNFATAATDSAHQPELVVETALTANVNWTVNGAEIDSETLALGEDGTAVAPLKAYSENGSNVMYASEEQTVTGNTTIALNAVANAGTLQVGDIFAKDGVQYEIKSENLVPNGDFSHGLAGWYNAANGVAGTDKFTVNGDGTITAKGNEGAAGASSLYRAWAIEKDKTYLFTFSSNVAQEYHKVSVKDDISATGDGTILANNSNNKNGSYEGTNNLVFTAANDYVQINFRWLASNNVIGNFGLYEITEAEVAVTETVDSVDAIAGVTVIGDTAVVLPATVKVAGSLGTEVNAPIVWDAPESYEVGTTTVEGVATVQFGEQDATTENVSTTVTVLEETFTVEDFTSVNGQDAAKANQRAFPVALTDTFFVEFIANYASFGDLFITMKTKDAGFFGPEQVALGANGSGAFRPVNGNGSGGRAVADSDHAILTAGTDYRFLVAVMPATNNYSVMVYDAATGVAVANAEYYGFRTNSGSIEVITALTNNGAGEIALSDIKVNANVSKTEYTFVVTKDDETTTTTGLYWTEAEAVASIADIEGYEKAVTVEGTTITVVYSNTKDVTITFVDADERVILEVSETVKTDEYVTVSEQEVYNAETCKFYTIPETVAETSAVITVSANENKIAVIADAFHNAGDKQPWNNDANMLFVGSAGVTNTDDTDANGENVTNKTDGGNLGSARVALVKFPVPELSENQAVKLHLYVAKANQNLGNGNWMKLAANVSNVEANEVENAYVAGDIADTTNLVWSDNAASAKADPVDGRMEVNEWVEVDVTNFVRAAEGETITFALYAPTAGFYVADREKAVAGGAYQGKAAYLSLEDAFVVTATGDATLTKNGSVMTTAYAVAGDDVRLNAKDAVVIGTDAGYYEANKNLNLTEATTFANTAPAALGLAMVSGAQVRVGATKLADGAKLDALADSGIRFLATADYADTLISDDAVEFGIKVSVEASDNVAYIEAKKFQNDDNTAFSAAITNLKESNYNRKYTAEAYAKVTMADGTVKEFVTEGVTRSIYQVSAGLMKEGDEPLEGVIRNILNAYVNQTGIRLTKNDEGITVEDGKYTGDVFFTVESVSDGDDGWNVTITPAKGWKTPASIATWWTDYVRVNNNNTIAKGYISANYYVDGEPVFVHDDGSLTFNFDTTDDGTGGFDGPWVPIG